MRKVDHSKTVCIVCKTNKTSHWRTYKTDKEGRFSPRYNEDVVWDGKSYICNICYGKEDRKLPDSHNNLIKGMRKWRNKQLSKYTNTGKGYIGEQIWCKWRGTKNCNIERDNFHSEDTIDPDYGIVQVKLAILTNGEWNINIGKEHNFDTVAILFMDNKNENIERLCIIPEKELDLTHLKIRKLEKYRNYSMASEICNKFYVDQNTCNSINDVYHSMKIENCNVLIDN